MKTAKLEIEGMSCAHCVNAVKTALTRQDGVRDAKVRIGTAEVEYDEGRISPEQLTAAVEEEGYGATVALK